MARSIEYYLEHPDEAPVTTWRGRTMVMLTMREKFHQYFRPGLPDECWEWQGSLTLLKYGMINLRNEHIMAHRVSFVLAGGSLVDPVVLHKCDNPPCCNPAHLRNGTHGDNVRDMMSKGRGWQQKKTCCKYGHEFTPENKLPKPNGSFQCLICHKDALRRVRQRQREARV